MAQSDLSLSALYGKFGQDTSAIVFPFPMEHLLLFNPNL